MFIFKNPHQPKINMKTLRFLGMLFVSMFLLLCPVSSDAAVKYPVIGENLHGEIAGIRSSGAFIGGEFVEIWQGEYVAVGIESNPQKGMLFQVSFEQASGLEDGFLEPILTSSDYKFELSILERVGWFTYEDGSKEIFGYCPCMGQDIYFYSWSWYDTDGYERWSVVVTWGNLSGIDKAGSEIERTNLGTLDTEPCFAGHELVTGDFLEDGDYAIGAVFDSEAEFTIDATTDLTTWVVVEGQLEFVPESSEYFEGVNFVGVIITPTLTPVLKASSRIFFRIK